MPLTTQCGRCGRRFAVYAQDLKTGRGRVECPQCGQRFDGLAALLDEPMERPAASSSNGRSRLAPEPLGPVAPAVAAKTRRTTIAWALLALLLALGLAAQALWWKRGDLLRDSGTRQVLEGVCDRMGCQVPKPRIPGTLTLLEPTLTTGPQAEVLVLRLKVRNQADQAQPTPILELELLDLQGDLAAVRRFSPAEYAPAAVGHLAPGQTLEATLSLVKPSPEPAGFRVRLL